MQGIPEVGPTLSKIRTCLRVSQESLARVLGVSFVSVNRWERGASRPSPAQVAKIQALLEQLDRGGVQRVEALQGVFASHGARRHSATLLEPKRLPIALTSKPGPRVIDRLCVDGIFDSSGFQVVSELLEKHAAARDTAQEPPDGGISAGKNSYTYDAHTYHTKVPPQGIAELIRHYLPQGGLVLDPFAGSGMTGVAARVTGRDCFLNELSPAASFIADRFVASVDPSAFADAVEAILAETAELRRTLYTTVCRECGQTTELLYVVWAYRVRCSCCGDVFQLWDVCRAYGQRVREHKILKEFDCPLCGHHLKKSRLERLDPEPVQVGYTCCGPRQREVNHPPDHGDLDLIASLAKGSQPVAGFFPTTQVPEGVNLNQPRKHGLCRIDQFYTPRNLTALSHIWRTIHRVEDAQLAAQLAFVFTSLYQRVTKLSEFRFWGGSGNTARFNVPFIFNESNVFKTFERKARTIQDHLATTALHFRKRALVVNGSATSLTWLPDDSVDFIFTDPPFGANINYSEMNLIWESWLEHFTDTREEAIVNRVQGKDIDAYGLLMKTSLSECFRVLRPGHWLALVFMNTSAKVWAALREAVASSGFRIVRVHSFDKQHGTFKQFVSENSAGEDLILHCRKPKEWEVVAVASSGDEGTSLRSAATFLRSTDLSKRIRAFLHVTRDAEIDVRALYSEWTSKAVVRGLHVLDFAAFRSLVVEAAEAQSRQLTPRQGIRRGL